MAEKLKPCAMCGAELCEQEDDATGTYWRHNSSPDCYLADAYIYPSDIPAWNRRADGWRPIEEATDEHRCLPQILGYDRIRGGYDMRWSHAAGCWQSRAMPQAPTHFMLITPPEDGK